MVLDISRTAIVDRAWASLTASSGIVATVFGLTVTIERLPGRRETLMPRRGC